MLGKFPLGDRWAAELFAELLPPSRAENVHPQQAAAVASRLARLWQSGAKDFGTLTDRLRAIFLPLDAAFEQSPEPLQQRESSLESDIHSASADDFETKFGSQLKLFGFLQEEFHGTLAAPFIIADAITRTGGPLSGLVDRNGRVGSKQIAIVETARGLRAGMLTDGANRHLRNCGAHHLYEILDDKRIKLWDEDPRTKHLTWGPVEWTHWELHTNVRRLSVTCSAFLLGLALFDITNGRTILGRGWGVVETPQPRRRDIARSQLRGPADDLGFAIERVDVAPDQALAIGLRVKGDTVIEQTKRIITGGTTPRAYERRVRTVWSPLRDQVYGFLQRTFDIHDGYELVRVTVAASDGTTPLGQIVAPLDARRAMLPGKEPVEQLRARLPVDTLAEEKIPLVLEGPIIPTA